MGRVSRPLHEEAEEAVAEHVPAQPVRHVERHRPARPLRRLCQADLDQFDWWGEGGLRVPWRQKVALKWAFSGLLPSAVPEATCLPPPGGGAHGKKMLLRGMLTSILERSFEDAWEHPCISMGSGKQ